MCGRFTLTRPEQLRKVFPEIAFPDPVPIRFNVAPSQQVLAAASIPGEAKWLKWGLVPSWAKDPSVGYKMINARADGVAEKPAYRAAFHKRRCIIFADGFYEWQPLPRSKHKQPMHFRIGDGEPFAFAGLWEFWRPKSEPGEGEAEPIRSCTILTTDANPLVAPVHNRMPVILDHDKAMAWLRADATDAELLALLGPFPADAMNGRPVSTAVNNAKHEGADCLEPPQPAP